MSDHQSTGESNQTHMVTVIMPIRNEVRYIQKSLGAVLAQDYPANHMEVIIADGMSNDGTREVVAQIMKEHNNIRLIDNPQKIVPCGLNAALKEAQGEIVIRVDGHCIIAQDFVSKCVQHLQEELVDCVGGPIETLGETTCSQAIALAMSSFFGVGGSPFRTVNNRRMLVDTVAFPAYTQKTIKQVGLFDEELVRNQDDEYNYRLRKMGGKILLSPDIRARYYSRDTLVSLWRQYFQYGFWKIRVFQKHPRQMNLRQFIPSIFVLALILPVFLALRIPQSLILTAVVLGWYILVNFSVTTALALRHGWIYFPYLFPAFAILHLSYGFGFWVGLLKFAHRWFIKQQIET